MRGKRASMKKQKAQTESRPSAESGAANTGEMKRLTIDISVSLHKRLKIISAKKGETMGNIVRDCIDSYLSEEERRET